MIWKSIDNEHEIKKGGEPGSFKSVPQTLPAAKYGEINTVSYPGAVVTKTWMTKYMVVVKEMVLITEIW